MPRLDQYIAALAKIKRKDVRLLLAQGRITVDGKPAADGNQLIDKFSRIEFDGEVAQDNPRYFVMLNKPIGVVSATVDKNHTTVTDLLDLPFLDQLHIAGRLDFNSTGLLLLTNDGRWSRRLSLPASGVVKRYRVRVEKPLTEDYITAFRRGMLFGYEGITTLPADLIILNEFEAEVGLVEGRYHQIKRMFGRFDNRVLNLHRFAIGPLQLDDALAPGSSRELTPAEALLIERIPRHAAGKRSACQLS